VGGVKFVLLIINKISFSESSTWSSAIMSAENRCIQPSDIPSEQQLDVLAKDT